MTAVAAASRKQLHQRKRRLCYCCRAFTHKPGVSSIIILIIAFGSFLQIRTSLMNPYLSASTILGINNSSNNRNSNSNSKNRKKDSNDDDQRLPLSSSSSLSLSTSSLDRRRQQSTTTTTTAPFNTHGSATTTRMIHRHDQKLDPTAQIQQQQQSEPVIGAPRIVWLEQQQQQQEEEDGNPQHQTQIIHRTVQPLATAPCLYCQKEPDDYIWPIERRYYDECKPMADWQTHFYPTCNLFHEISLGDAAIFNNMTNGNTTTTEATIATIGTGVNSTTTKTTTKMSSIAPSVAPQQQRTQTDTLELLSMSGSWRSAWKRTSKAIDDETVVLKLLKFTTRDFDHESLEHHRIDATVMERLTHSPYIISAYGYCGQSVMTEYASGTAREHTKNKHLNSRERLKMGRDLARAVAQLHSMDYPNSTNATFAHNDINIANAVQVNGNIIKLNDFNIGMTLRWNHTHNKPCGIPVRFEAPLWKSPEENANSSYVDAAQADVYGLGNLLFQVLTTRQPWTHLEPGGKLTPDQVAVRKAARALPYIPTPIVQSSKIGIQALYFATVACFRFDPLQRPTSHDLAVNLNVALQWARQKANVTRSQVEELFA